MNYFSTESELRIRIAAKQLPFHKYKRLCEWLNCFQYIPPDDRKVAKELYKLPHLTQNRALELFAFALWLDCVESTLTIPEQLCLSQLINEFVT